MRRRGGLGYFLEKTWVSSLKQLERSHWRCQSFSFPWSCFSSFGFTRTEPHPANDEKLLWNLSVYTAKAFCYERFIWIYWCVCGFCCFHPKDNTISFTWSPGKLETSPSELSESPPSSSTAWLKPPRFLTWLWRWDQDTEISQQLRGSSWRPNNFCKEGSQSWRSLFGWLRRKLKK